MEKTNKLVIILSPLVLLAGLFFTKGVSAACVQDQQSCSTSYGVGEYFFGSGGTVDNAGTDAYCSADYCASETLGGLGVGLTSSADYQAYPGFEVNRDPSLLLMVNTTSVNLGNQSVGTTTVAYATFSVESYLSSGYVVETVSSPPSNGSHTIATPSTPTAAQTGVEQFGINLASNLTTCSPPAPDNFGAAPEQVPSSSFSYGVVSANYAHCGEFLYNPGDTIAYSDSSSGETLYTISYIMDISNTTPAGVYTMNQDLVAIPTF